MQSTFSRLAARGTFFVAVAFSATACDSGSSDNGSEDDSESQESSATQDDETTTTSSSTTGETSTSEQDTGEEDSTGGDETTPEDGSDGSESSDPSTDTDTDTDTATSTETDTDTATGSDSEDDSTATTDTSDELDCQEAEASGTAVGDIVPDLTLPGNDGKNHSLREVCDNPVYIVNGSMWCPTCNSHAKQLKDLVTEFPNKPFVIYNIMNQDADSEVPDTADLAAWAQKYEFADNMFALGDADSAAYKTLYPGNNGYMGEMVLDAGGKIVCTTSTESACKDAFKELLAK
jgi:peroxiredoxin